MKTNQTNAAKFNNIKNHKHTWIASSIAIIGAIVTFMFLPDDRNLSVLFAGFAFGHIIIALIAIFTGWLIVPEKFIRKFWKRKTIEGYDFGWSTKWINSYWIASILVFFMAIHVFFSLNDSPVLQLIVYSGLLLLSVNFLLGNIVISNSNRSAQITLPLVNLHIPENGKILDAGCGAGRTTIAMGKAISNVNIVSFDRFDAKYIAGGGIELLSHNIKLAGIENRVSIEKGDITKTNFSNNSFDAVVSSFMLDHLHNSKQKALQETYRIMKPGGRFLLIIVVPGFSSFAIANVICLLISSRKKWINWIEQTGFKMVCDGNINEGAYFCFEKPNKI